MPTYSYKCTECGTAFDIQQAFTDDTLTELIADRPGASAYRVEGPAPEITETRLDTRFLGDGS